MNTQNEQVNQRTEQTEMPRPGAFGNGLSLAAGAATTFGVLKLGARLNPSGGFFARAGYIALAALGGLGVSGMVFNIFHRRAFNRAARAGELPDHPGFGPPHGPPLHEQTNIDAAAPSAPSGALDAALNGMDRAGLTHIADAVRRHRQDPAFADTYQAMDSWMTELAYQSPETFAHLQREAVMLAMFADSVDYAGPQQLRDGLIARVIMAGIVHDIGKLAFNAAVTHANERFGPNQTAGINAAFNIDPAIVNAELPDTHLSAGDKLLRDVVQLTDSYASAADGHAQSTAAALAEKVAQGSINAQSLKLFDATGIAQKFDAVQADIAPTNPGAHVQAADASLEATLAESLALETAR